MAKKASINKFAKFFSTTPVICIMTAILLTILNYYAIYFPWLIVEQGPIVKSTEVKKLMREDDKKPNNLSFNRIAKDFLLIDISNDATVYCDSNASGNLGLPVDKGSKKSAPCYTGTDIKKLTQLFKWLASHKDQFKLVVCDLLFDKLDTTPETKPLLGYLINLQSDTPRKIIFASIYDEYNGRFNTSTFSKNLLDECKGAVNEEQTGSQFFKYRLSYSKGAVKSLPLLMLEKINSYSITHGNFGLDTYKNGATEIKASNLFIPEMLFLPEDIDSLKMPGNADGPPVDTTVSKMELWQTVLKFNNANSYYLQEILKSSSRKTVFIGSFNHTNADVHKTLYGDMDGGIILMNIYYNLLMKGNKISLSYNLFIFFCFFIISLLILNPPHELYQGKWLIVKVGLDIFVEELQYIVLLLMCVLSSILFDKACNVVVLFLVIFLMVKITSAYKSSKAFANKKNVQKISGGKP